MSESKPPRICRLCGKATWGVHSCKQCASKHTGATLSRYYNGRRKRGLF